MGQVLETAAGLLRAAPGTVKEHNEEDRKAA